MTKTFGKEYIEQAISYFENLCDDIDDFDSFSEKLKKEIKKSPVQLYKPEVANGKFLRKHGLTFFDDPWSSNETKFEEDAAPSFAVFFENVFYCVDGQHRLNHRIALGLEVPMIVVDGDWMKKFGVTKDCFHGKVPKIKPVKEDFDEWGIPLLS